MTLGGTLCVKDGNALDYCWKEALASLLGVCDQVVLCWSDSTDNTAADCAVLSMANPKIKLVHYRWTDPVGDPDSYSHWIDFARNHLWTDWHIQIDADEMLHQDDYALILEQAQGKPKFCQRINFWRDAKHLIPDGQCVHRRVFRLAPAHVKMGSHGPLCFQWQDEARPADSRIRIFHYGFIRKDAAFRKKAPIIYRMLEGINDTSFDKNPDGKWQDIPGIATWQDQVEPYHGDHPHWAKPWLAERGYVL